MKNPCLYLLACILFLTSCTGLPNNAMMHEMKSLSGQASVQIATFDGSHLTGSQDLPLGKINPDGSRLRSKGAVWFLTADIEKTRDREGAYGLTVKARLEEGESAPVALGLQLVFEDWSTDNYVLMPAAAYNGNRFHAMPRRRGVHLCDQFLCGPDMEISISTVPRLNIGEGSSKIDLLAGDMSLPSLGFRSASTKKGFFMLTEQGAKQGDYSYRIEESPDRSTARILLRMPGVREDSCQLGNNMYPSPDRGIRLNQRDEISLSCRLYFFDAPEIRDLFDYLIAIRKDIGSDELECAIPYSSIWEIQEEKYNRQNWVEKYGYYSVGMRESTYQDWQTGWTGGMNAVFPLLVNGSELTRQRSLRTFDFLFDTISPSGFFYGVFHDGVWHVPRNMAFLRRNSDALYFIIKSYHFIEDFGLMEEIPSNWIESARGSADAYVRLYEKYGNFGQWIDFDSGDIVAGPTSSNGIAPAALALCAGYFGEEKYMDAARGAARYYYEHFVRRGITNGGPGDIYQNDDSESAFGLLESYIILYEQTGEPEWLEMARETAAQCASWVVPYNFSFPPQSTFARLGMQTTGTVIANVQNKHSAPGICSLSGNSLFKLYRYTGDRIWLELIREISRTIPQYMSRADRPIPDIRPGVPWPVMDPGWINERVNMSDWEERGTPGDIKRGEIFGGSTWSEVACMLSHAELPGIYILKDREEITVLDNVEADIVESDDEKLEIRVYNPTGFDAAVKVFAENSGERNEILDENLILEAVEWFIPAGKTLRFLLNR
jgi:hypothetical protein